MLGAWCPSQELLPWLSVCIRQNLSQCTLHTQCSPKFLLCSRSSVNTEQCVHCSGVHYIIFTSLQVKMYKVIPLFYTKIPSLTEQKVACVINLNSIFNCCLRSQAMGVPSLGTKSLWSTGKLSTLVSILLTFALWECDTTGGIFCRAFSFSSVHESYSLSC